MDDRPELPTVALRDPQLVPVLDQGLLTPLLDRDPQTLLDPPLTDVNVRDSRRTTNRATGT